MNNLIALLIKQEPQPSKAEMRIKSEAFYNKIVSKVEKIEKKLGEEKSKKKEEKT